jgi:hypothetical protein
MTIHELEDLLGVPREHLEFNLWYLKEGGLVTRGDNGRCAITVKGVDEAENDRPMLVAGVGSAGCGCACAARCHGSSSRFRTWL